jgi:hypothetical protein
MTSRRSQRGSALLVAVIVLLVIAVFGVAVVRFASREVAGSVAGRKEAAVSACAEAARTYLMGQWKLLGTHDVNIPPMRVQLESVTPTVLSGGHYGQDPSSSTYWNSAANAWISNVQVVAMDAQSVGPAQVIGDISNRIGDQVTPYRVTVHCTQGTAPNARELELEFGVQYGL